MTKKMVAWIVSIVLCVSMCMTAYANESLYEAETDENLQLIEADVLVSIMPRYTANLDFDEIPVGYVYYGQNQFNLSAGTKIFCNFESTGKFSLALFNRDIGRPWTSEIIHESSCSYEITVPVDGTYSIGVYNRDSKPIKVTGSYSL